MHNAAAAKAICRVLGALFVPFIAHTESQGGRQFAEGGGVEKLVAMELAVGGGPALGSGAGDVSTAVCQARASSRASAAVAPPREALPAAPAPAHQRGAPPPPCPRRSCACS